MGDRRQRAIARPVQPSARPGAGILPIYPLQAPPGSVLRTDTLNQAVGSQRPFPSPGPWGLRQLPTCVPPVPLKCDRWAEFPWQFKHFALICVLVCILFRETNFKTGSVRRPSKLTGTLSSFRDGRSSDSSRRLPRPWQPALHPSQLGVPRPRLCPRVDGGAGRWGRRSTPRVASWTRPAQLAWGPNVSRILEILLL